METKESARIPLVEAALKLGRTYQATRDAVLRGELDGGRTPQRKWYVEKASVESLLDRSATATAAAA